MGLGSGRRPVVDVLGHFRSASPDESTLNREPKAMVLERINGPEQEGIVAVYVRHETCLHLDPLVPLAIAAPKEAISCEARTSTAAIPPPRSCRASQAPDGTGSRRGIGP